MRCAVQWKARGAEAARRASRKAAGASVLAPAARIRHDPLAA